MELGASKAGVGERAGERAGERHAQSGGAPVGRVHVARDQRHPDAIHGLHAEAAQHLYVAVAPAKKDQVLRVAISARMVRSWRWRARHRRSTAQHGAFCRSCDHRCRKAGLTPTFMTGGRSICIAAGDQGSGAAWLAMGC
jgi:hypothetical protein